MRRPDLRLALAACAGLILCGCSAQVSGMQSPVLHDYGPLDWLPLERQVEQSFIAGSGYSAAVENDPETTPRQLQTRLAALPRDATDGDLVEIRIGLRLPDARHGAWSTGARVQISQAEGPPEQGGASHVVHELGIDDLSRAGERIVLRDLPAVEAGSVIQILLLPGDGPQAGELEYAITPHRQPYGGWRATSDGDLQAGALVFQTRYQRDVDLAAVLGAAGNRLTDGGPVFVALWSVGVAGLLAGVVVVGRKREAGANGR